MTKKERIKSCGDVSLEALAAQSHEETLTAHEGPTGDEYPTPEQVMVRYAIKYLTPKQRAIWEYHIFDKLTQDEIAEKMRITQQAVAKHIKAAERRITKYCKSNLGAYQLIKKEMEKESL